MHLAGAFCSFIDRLYPGLNISVHTEADQKRFVALETAKRVVIFISEKFISSEQHVQELHWSINRQRSSDENILYLILASDVTSRPFFPRILPYNIVCSDSVWKEFQNLHLNGSRLERKTVFSKYGSRLGHASTFFCLPSEYFAMEKAVNDVLESLIHKT